MEIWFKHTSPIGFFTEEQPECWPVRPHEHLPLVNAVNDYPPYNIVQDDAGYASIGDRQPMPLPTAAEWASVVLGYVNELAAAGGYSSIQEAAMLAPVEAKAKKLLKTWAAVREAASLIEADVVSGVVTWQEALEHVKQP